MIEVTKEFAEKLKGIVNNDDFHVFYNGDWIVDITIEDDCIKLISTSIPSNTAKFKDYLDVKSFKIYNRKDNLAEHMLA